MTTIFVNAAKQEIKDLLLAQEVKPDNQLIQKIDAIMDKLNDELNQPFHSLVFKDKRIEIPTESDPKEQTHYMEEWKTIIDGAFEKMDNGSYNHNDFKELLYSVSFFFDHYMTTNTPANNWIHNLKYILRLKLIIDSGFQKLKDRSYDHRSFRDLSYSLLFFHDNYIPIEESFEEKFIDISKEIHWPTEEEISDTNKELHKPTHLFVLEGNWSDYVDEEPIVSATDDTKESAVNVTGENEESAVKDIEFMAGIKSIIEHNLSTLAYGINDYDSHVSLLYELDTIYDQYIEKISDLLQESVFIKNLESIIDSSHDSINSGTSDHNSYCYMLYRLRTAYDSFKLCDIDESSDSSDDASNADESVE